MTPKRTDECQTCGHSWEFHEPIPQYAPEDTSCDFPLPFGESCECAEFVLRELLPQLDQQP